MRKVQVRPREEYCCRRLLYSQPDFTKVKSSLEIEVEKRGFTMFFLPKFHCELNFIEMVWGRALHFVMLGRNSEDLSLEAVIKANWVVWRH